MRFEHPGVLWALLLLAIPIIIHLFHFKRFKTLYFSSLIFVKQIEQETKSVKKLKHLLILISRLLAFAALILAFAKPYIPLSENTLQGKTTAIYIDNSFSMTNLGSEGQLFETAKNEARSIIGQLNDDETFLIVSNDQSAGEQRKYSKAEALQRVNELTVSPFSRTFSETANWIQTQLENEEEKVLSRLIYISDFPVQTFGNDLILNKSTQLYPIQLVAQKSSNISIDSAWFTNPNFRLNTPNELQVIIRNHGDQNIDNLALTLKTNQTQRDIFINVRANDTTQITVNYTDNKKGWVNGKLSILDEGIIFDDDLFFSYEVQEHNNLVIIDGEDAVPNIKTVYELDPFYSVQSFNDKSVDNSVIQKANTIILNGLNNYPSGLTELLAAKAKEGTGIAVFPGKNIALPEINIFLQAIGLNGIARKVNEKFTITKLNSNDLFFKGVFQKLPKTLSLPAQNNYLKVNPSGRTISLLQFENSDPVLLRSSELNTFLFAGSLFKGDGNFMSNAIFSTTLLRIGELSKSEKPLYLTIGENTRYPVLQEQAEKPLRLAGENFEFIPLKTTAQGKSWISVYQIPGKNITAGQYTISDDKEIGHLSLNYDRSESELRFVKMSDFEQALKEKGFHNIKSSILEKKSLISPINTANAKEYWKLLLILSLLFFFTEMALIKFWK